MSASLKRLNPIIEDTAAFEEELKGLTDDALRAKTPYFKEKTFRRRRAWTISSPRAFAVAREAARRTVNMRHFDVQLIGGGRFSTKAR